MLRFIVLPINNELLCFILSHGANKAKTLQLIWSNVTNQMVKEIAERIKERKEPVIKVVSFRTALFKTISVSFQEH